MHRRHFVRPPAPTSFGMSLAQLLHRVRRWACTVVHACSLLHTVLETSWRASRASSRTVAATLATLSLHSNQDVSAFLCYERPDSKTRSLSVPVHSATVSVDFRECGAARPRGCFLALPRPSLHDLVFSTVSELHSFQRHSLACTRNLRINKLENQASKQPATKVCGACGRAVLWRSPAPERLGLALRCLRALHACVACVRCLRAFSDRDAQWVCRTWVARRRGTSVVRQEEGCSSALQ